MSNELIPFSALREMASTMAVSGMFGKSKEQMLALMLIAQAENLHPAIAAMEYDVIQNRPALKGQAALARFQQSGGSIKWITRTDTEAKATFSHPKGGELTISWTMDKARKMKLDQKDNWQKQPSVMLSWRCIAEGVRAVYPACLNRMYLAEEVQDFEPMRDVTPPAQDERPAKQEPLVSHAETPEPQAVTVETIPVEDDIPGDDPGLDAVFGPPSESVLAELAKDKTARGFVKYARVKYDAELSTQAKTVIDRLLASPLTTDEVFNRAYNKAQEALAAKGIAI